jgi:hypothetical protein
MGRPKILDEAKMMPVVLDRETRAIVEKKKGDGGVSSFIRGLIREDMDNGVESEDLVTSLRIRLKEAEAKVYAFEKKEKAVSKEKEETMAYIQEGFKLYKKGAVRNVDDPETCRRWIVARCKGSGISASDFLRYQVGLEYQAHFLRSFTD